MIKPRMKRTEHAQITVDAMKRYLKESGTANIKKKVV
jgi:hypothetical protein